MTAMTAVLWYIVWMLVLTLFYAGYRLPRAFIGKKPLNSWTRGQTVDDPAIITRANHAHMNCVENLPVFAAIVLVAFALGKNPVVDAVAVWVLGLRVAQGVVHLIGTSSPLVFVRANLFIAQLALYFYMIWQLMH